MKSKIVSSIVLLAAAAVFGGGGGLGSSTAQAATIQIQYSEQKAVTAARVKLLHYGDLLNNAEIRKNLEIELQHLNSDRKGLSTDVEPWRFGAVVPAGFQFTANKASLDKIILPSASQSFGRTGKIGVFRDGRLVGYRTVELYFFAVAPTRNVGKPYTAEIMVARDINTGLIIFVHSLVREFEDNNPLVIHEFAVRDGSLVRLSNKKGETTILGSYSVSAGVSKASAEFMSKRTLPAAQQAASMFAQTKQLISSDNQAAQNQTIATTITLSTSEKEKSWWNQARTELLDALKKSGQEILKQLLELAKDFLKTIGGAIADALKSVVSAWLKGILVWLGF